MSSAKAALAAADSAEPHRDKGRAESSSEDGELDLTPGTLEKTNDPVRMYLREMGTVPLLTREGEVAIAKRIERGQLLVLKTITRAPLILKELLQVGEDLRNGSRSIKEIVQFDDEELTEEKIEAKTRETLKQIDKIAKLYLHGDEAGGQAGAGSALEEAALSARPLRAVPHARRDVQPRARPRFQSARKEAPDRQDSPDRRARSFPRARNREARAPRRSLEGRRAGRSAQGSEGPPHRNSAKSKSPAKSAPRNSSAPFR